jgi:hypothetical protein
MAHGGRSPALYKSRKLARKCHNNSEKKEREGWGEESEGAEQRSSADSSLHYWYFVDFNYLSYLT